MCLSENERRKYLALPAFYLEQKESMEKLQKKLAELSKVRKAKVLEDQKADA